MLDCSPRNEGRGPVIEDLIQGGLEAAAAYESLLSMLGTLEEAYESGAIFIGEDGLLDFDDQAYANIARTRNPSVEMWRS